MSPLSIKTQIPLFIATLAGIAYGHDAVVPGLLLYLAAYIVRQREHA